MEASQRDHNKAPLHFLPQNSSKLPKDPDYFIFLRTDGEKFPRSPSFFSEKGLDQDIIKVTRAEPDICLEVFYALYHTLWPQIERWSDITFKDAWTNFIGGPICKGILCPPEKLITERSEKDLKRIFSEADGEKRIFYSLDRVISSISHLKRKIDDYPGEILYRKEIIESLNSVQGFYQDYRNQLKSLLQLIIEQEQMNIWSSSEFDALEDLLEPKSIMMGDIFLHHWAFRIPRNIAQKLLSLNVNGHKLKRNRNDPSNHRVIALPENVPEPLVFFKANRYPSIRPEKGFMLYSLYQNLQIPVPETALLILTDVSEADPDYFYALQASEAVLGESPLKAFRDQEKIFEQEGFISQAIAALMTNPSDGSFNNFKYSPKYKTFISLSNDLIFKPELVGEKCEKIVNTKSMLYLFPQIDLPIPESLQTFFTTLDPHLFVLSWLQDLSQKNREYQLLFARLSFQKTRCLYQNFLPQNETFPLSYFLKKKMRVDPKLDHYDFFQLQIRVSKDLVTNLAEKLQIIEKTLVTNRLASTQILFEEISPEVGKYYRKLREEYSDPEEALEALWGHKKNGVDYSKISSLVENEEEEEEKEEEEKTGEEKKEEEKTEEEKIEEELSDLSRKKNKLDEKFIPEKLMKESRNLLISQENAFDRFISRHDQRKKKNTLNLQTVLKELRLLIQEGLTNSHQVRKIIDFHHSLSKMIDSDHSLLKRILSLFANLPQPKLKWLFTLEKYFMRSDTPIPEHLLPSSPVILGASLKKRTFTLTESEKKWLFDKQGNPKKSSHLLTGRSNVTCFPEKLPKFYLKQYPEFPGYEFASTLLMRLLGVTCLPFQELIIINSNIQTKSYPVLLSEKIDGDPVFDVWQNPQAFKKLDPVHTALLIISAMLLNPEDGKGDNFLLSSNGRYLIPIDSDHCFLPSSQKKEGSFWKAFTANTALQTKTLLFCLDEMNQPLPFEVKRYFISIDFDSFLFSWMKKLEKVEGQYQNLADKEQQRSFLNHGTVLGIPFYEKFIRNMYWKAHKIQDLLKSGNSEQTPFDLLEAVEPFAARCYKNCLKLWDSLEDRFKAATNQLSSKLNIDKNRISILDTRRTLNIINILEKDLQSNGTYNKMGPSRTLELLNDLIKERSPEQELLCDLNEKNQESTLKNLFWNPLLETALKDFFINPREGLVLKGSKLIVSQKLTSLFALAPYQTAKIKFLSLPNSPLLDCLTIRALVEGCPNLEYLDVSGCDKLKEISTVEEEWPLLTRFEATNCLNLEKYVSYSPIKILRIETDQKVEIFVEKSTLEIFTISKKKVGFEFSFKKGENFEIKSQGQILSNSYFLVRVLLGKEEVRKYFNNFEINMEMHSILPENELRDFITLIDLGNSNLETQGIQRIVLLNLRNLMSLDLSQNALRIDSLEYLIHGDWPKLNHVDLSENYEISDKGVEILSRGRWPLLENLNLSKINMTAAGVEMVINQTNWAQLKHINLSNNEILDKGIETLAKGNWSLLETLNLSKTSMTGVGVEIIVNQVSWPQLKHINLSHNEIFDEGIQTFTKGNWSLLQTLNLHETKMTSVGVQVLVFQAKLQRLKLLDLSKNPIHDEGFEILSQGNWPLLEILDLYGTSFHETVIDNFSLERVPGKRMQVPKKRFLHFILNTKWPNLKKVYFDSQRTNDAKYLLPDDWHALDNLDLSSCNIKPNEIKVIVSKCSWSQLKDLDLSENKICDEGLEMMASSNWNQLECIYLEKTCITEKGIKLLISKSHWPNLKEFDISQNSIGDEGLKALSSGKWPLLEKLYLRKINITEKGIESMVRISDWPKLKVLGVSHNDFTGGKTLFERLSLVQTHMTADIDLGRVEESFIRSLVYQKWGKISLTSMGGHQKRSSPVIPEITKLGHPFPNVLKDFLTPGECS